ncbi:MAG: hypothetical protein GX348_09180 [Veillonellaceae bacterium]|jgi:hypothetical protein|nr:hypothetical protein [Veillonellaceae bacterium]
MVSEMTEDIYKAMAMKFKPDNIKIVLLAESPPAMPQNNDFSQLKYFYNVEYANNQKDILLRETAKVILDDNNISVRTKEEKIAVLEQLKVVGVYLVDTVKYPINKSKSKDRRQAIIDGVPALITELKELNAERIIIVMKSIYDLVSQELKNAGLPIVDVPVNSPFGPTKKGFDYKTTLRRALNCSVY